MTVYQYFPDIVHNPIFRGASEDSVNRTLTEDALTLATFSDHQLIYSSETSRLSVGILCSGCAHVHAGHGEESTLLNSLGQGDMFGIANLFDEDSPFPTRIVAAAETQVLFVEGDAFRRCILEDERILRNYLAFQSKKLMYLNRKIMTFTAGSAERRLLLFLLERQVCGEVLLPCSMSELAERLGIGRASLYRARDALVRDGLLILRKGGFFLPDPKALEKRFEST